MPTSVEKSHGELIERTFKAAPIEAESCGFPHAAQVLEETCRHLDRDTLQTKLDPKTGQPRVFIRHFITSLRPGEAGPKKLAALIRGHWGVENRNHWRRDASRWQEDKCLLRTPRAAHNFALLRNALLALIPLDRGPLDELFDHFVRRPSAAIRLLNSKLRPD